MLSERPRNILVGLTILVALAVLMYGIVLLGKFPSLTLSTYQVTLLAADANGVGAGSQVLIKGVNAGEVKSVDLVPDKSGELQARVIIQVDHKFSIPDNSTIILMRPPTGVGSPLVTISFSSTKGPLLPTDGSAVTHAIPNDTSLIPKEIFADVRGLSERLSGLAGDLSTVAHDLHTLLEYAPPEAVDAANPSDPNRVRENASTVVIRLNRTIKSLQDLLTDPKLQANVREAIQNIADASAQLKTTIQKVDTVIGHADTAFSAVSGAATQASTTLDTTRQEIARVSQRLVQTLAQIEKSVREISEGDGTTGLLVRDPRLYDGLLDLSKSLKSTVDNLDFLLQKWKDEGVDLHLK